MAKKRISDSVRDKIVKSRKGGGHPGITLTDSDACEIWSVLSTVEADIYNFKRDLNILIKERFRRLEESILASKKELREAGVKKRKAYNVQNIKTKP